MAKVADRFYWTHSTNYYKDAWFILRTDTLDTLRRTEELYLNKYTGKFELYADRHADPSQSFNSRREAIGCLKKFYGRVPFKHWP